MLQARHWTIAIEDGGNAGIRSVLEWHHMTVQLHPLLMANYSKQFVVEEEEDGAYLNTA